MDRIRVLVVDDHDVVRKGIQMIVNTEPAIQIIGEARDGQDAICQAHYLQPDVVLMDLVMSPINGIEAIAQIKQDYPKIKIIVLTTFEDEDKINAAMKFGADGYLLKDADGEFLLQAIQAVHQGDMPLHPRIARYLFKGETAQDETNRIDRLTEREKQILQLVAQGHSNKEIAELLSLTKGTVKVHVSNILGKLGVSSRTESAVLAAQLGLIAIAEDTL